MELKLTNSDNELNQILSLQNENHFTNISEELKKQEGFVTVKHDFDLLKKMNDMAKHVIALENDKVVGYALVMMKSYQNMIPVLVPMFNTFKSIPYGNTTLDKLNYYVMGQVCIAEGYRGKGIFHKLYLKHKNVYASSFDLCVTEVSSSNIRSMRAHEKVGFKTIHTFKDESDEWNILCWDWS